MVTHYFAGCLVFLFFGKFFGWDISWLYLLVGSIVGALPDILSLLITQDAEINKWSHLHRDNLTHTIFMPIIIFLGISAFNIKIALVVGLAILTHPILDLFGIGWGVKLFYPFSDIQIKLFHEKGKIAYNQEEIDAEAEKYGDEDWLRTAFSTLNPTSISEVVSLVGVIAIIVMYYFYAE